MAHALFADHGAVRGGSICVHESLPGLVEGVGGTVEDTSAVPGEIVSGPTPRSRVEEQYVYK